jgi:hypothetical protein
MRQEVAQYSAIVGIVVHNQDLASIGRAAKKGIGAQTGASGRFSASSEAETAPHQRRGFSHAKLPCTLVLQVSISTNV